MLLFRAVGISACLISLFWSIWSLQLWHFTVVGPSAANTRSVSWLRSPKHTNIFRSLHTQREGTRRFYAFLQHCGTTNSLHNEHSFTRVININETSPIIHAYKTDSTLTILGNFQCCVRLQLSLLRTWIRLSNTRLEALSFILGAKDANVLICLSQDISFVGHILASLVLDCIRTEETPSAPSRACLH